MTRVSVGTRRSIVVCVLIGLLMTTSAVADVYSVNDDTTGSTTTVESLAPAGAGFTVSDALFVIWLMSRLSVPGG